MTGYYEIGISLSFDTTVLNAPIDDLNTINAKNIILSSLICEKARKYDFGTIKYIMIDDPVVRDMSGWGQVCAMISGYCLYGLSSRISEVRHRIIVKRTNVFP